MGDSLGLNVLRMVFGVLPLGPGCEAAPMRCSQDVRRGLPAQLLFLKRPLAVHSV